MSSVGDASFVCLHIASLVTDVSDVRYAIRLSLGELLCFNVEGMLEFRWVPGDRAIRHTVVHHSSTSTYISNFIEIRRKFFSKVTTEVLVKFRVT